MIYLHNAHKGKGGGGFSRALIFIWLMDEGEFITYTISLLKYTCL